MLVSSPPPSDICIPAAWVATASRPAPDRWRVLVAVEPFADRDIAQRSLASGIRPRDD